MRTMAHAMETKIATFLLDHNRKQSALFTSPDAVGGRQLYRAKHPTEIAALKCMDGRLNLAIMTETPPGIIQPFRNIGGKFDLGWPHFGQVFEGWVNYSISRGRRCLVLVTYHFSKGDAHRGCAGHAYDTIAARENAAELVRQIDRVFGGDHATVHPILVGIETDEDALVLHGEHGTVNLADEYSGSTGKVERSIQEKVYPDMQPEMIADLMPLVIGNLRHIDAIRKAKRPIADAEHKEQVLAVGRGFDWLHLPNKALIVGPYSYNLGDPIAVAGTVLLGNIKAGRIRGEDGVVLLSSAAYRKEQGFEQYRAVEKARALARFALATLHERVPELKPYLRTLVGTTDFDTRLFTPLPFEE